MAVLVRTLLTFHFMAASVASDARPEKKVKFSALFAQKTAQIGRDLANSTHTAPLYAYIKFEFCNHTSPGVETHTPSMSLGAFKLQFCTATSPLDTKKHMTRGSRQQANWQTYTGEDCPAKRTNLPVKG